MRPVSDIQGRLRYLLSEELDRRVQLASQRLPGHCVHNLRHPVDVRKTIDGQPNENYNRIALPVIQQSLGLCTLGMEDPQEWNGTICEDPIDAQRCPYFNSKISKGTVQEDFEAQTQDPEWLKDNLPEIHGLVWVLSEPVRIPWWKSLLFWFLRIRVEPLREVPVNLLTEKSE